MKETKNITFKIATGKPKGVCPAYHCTNKIANRKRFCAKHTHRHLRDTDPLRYAFYVLKGNALRRGKVFTLTLPEFKQFCQETDYLKKRGKTGKSASIDRIDNSRGYEAGNIRILTLAENSHKRQVEDYPF